MRRMAALRVALRARNASFSRLRSSDCVKGSSLPDRLTLRPAGALESRNIPPPAASGRATSH